ncbi:MAG: DUF4395 domain-containing protein [Solirubrobacteraceae bacterium]|nr:DUF4395 domain-containing protein [Solirubrobacteraceae bacterium]
MAHPLLTFPNPVNEVAARVVAGFVALLGLLAVVFQLPWLAPIMAVGFALRVACGPKLSPLGLLATRVIVPRLPFEAKMVSGPPKRFAQTVGLVFTATATVLFFGVGATTAGYVLMGGLVAAATLESAFGFCLGCKAFALLMRVGVIPEEVCEACSDIWAGRTPPTAQAQTQS